jgi:NAD(P)-dependent dehydrogenase (short-subunit alcohol dehydrogenase family)
MTNKVVDRKVVLVTGASQNLGYETVKALLQSTQLYHVFLGCLYFNEGEAAVKHLKEDVPDTRSVVEALHIDVSSDDSIAQCFEKVNAVYGRLDVLINNAGRVPGWPRSLSLLKRY